MRIKSSSYLLIGIMVFALIIIVSSLGHPFKVTLLPLLISIIVFLLAAVELRKELSAKDKPREAPEMGKIEGNASGGYVPVLSWLAGLAIGIYLLGFLVAIPLFITSYLKTQGKNWLTTISVAILTTVFLWAAFEFMLEVELYRGLLFIWARDLIYS